MRPRSTSPQCPRVWYLIRKTPLWYFVGGHDRPQEEPQPGPFLPRSWTVFGGSSWGLSWRHFCVKETDESTEKIHGKSMTPRKKSMENSCNPFSNPQTHPWTPKFMTPTGAEVRPPRRPKGSRTPISTLGRPGAQVPLGPLGPPWLSQRFCHKADASLTPIMAEHTSIIRSTRWTS